MYEKATLKIWGGDIPRISLILPIFGHFYWVQNVERHLKHILYTQGNFLKVVKSSILSESRDYGSVALKCLTPRFALFAFSLLFTLGKKVFCSANQAPAMGVFGKQKNEKLLLLFTLKTSMFSEFLSPPQPLPKCCNSPSTLMKSIFSKGWKHSGNSVIELE